MAAVGPSAASAETASRAVNTPASSAAGPDSRDRFPRLDALTSGTADLVRNRADDDVDEVPIDRG
jgi:hypothetical protein